MSLKAPKNSYKKYKKNYFDSYAHKKSYCYNYGKNILSSIIGGRYMVLKVKEFCFFACIEQLFFKKPVSKPMYEKRNFAENKVKVHLFEVPVFLVSLIERLSFCLF